VNVIERLVNGRRHDACLIVSRSSPPVQAWWSRISAGEERTGLARSVAIALM